MKQPKKISQEYMEAIKKMYLDNILLESIAKKLKLKEDDIFEVYKELGVVGWGL